ncbi:MAG TPA: protease pro-enzyme activation domain-containing protein [Acidimicrobiales bacterium]|nr:protease pro-enzyme activation domain-containing protein [Acidimicrobiales bacterium]
MVLRRSAAVLLAGAALTPLAGAATSSAAAVSPTALVTVTPRAEVPLGARYVSRVAPSSPVTFGVVLSPRNPAALSSYAQAVSAPGSPEFHRYLSRSEFASRFGASSSTRRAVESTLRANGLTVHGVAANGLFVTVSAPAARVESTFHTSLADYRLASGRVAMTATTALKLPARISRAVQTVVGLDDLVTPQSAGIIRASLSAHASYPKATASAVPSVSGAPQACSAASTAASAFGGLTDSQIANSYGAFGLYKSGDLGAGQTIAVYELEPFARSDISSFDQCYFGDSAASSMMSRLTTTAVDGGQPSGPGSGEAVLDVEDVSAIAPAANIDVYEAPNTTFGAFDEYSTIVSQDTAKVVTSSWGLCEQAVQLGEPGVQQAENVLFEEAAAQGQTVLAAAGDTGSDNCNAFRSTVPPANQPVLSVDDPASQPYVTAVGGTTIDAATQPPTEHVWNDGAVWGGGGGGISQSWPMPSWQLDAKVPGLDNSTAVAAADQVMQAWTGNTSYSFCLSQAPAGPYETACREVPDVSAQADEFTGAITIYSSMFIPFSLPTAPGWITIGGTSSATPIWAALLADTNASATCASNPATSDGVGFANPLLYAVASNPTAYAASFNDVTAGNNDVYGVSGGATFPATKGYDMATGLGSPELTGLSSSGAVTAGLSYYLCSMAASATRPTVTGLSPTVVPTQGTPPVQVTGANFGSTASGSFVPDVAGVTVAGTEVPAADVRVTSPTTLTLIPPNGSEINPPGSPADGAGPADVVVTLSDGQSSAPSAASTLQYVDENSSSQTVPAVTGVGPYGGPEAGTNTVSIYGSGFAAGAAVSFGGVASPKVTVDSSYEITAEVPAYSSSNTTCATAGQLPAGENASNDICQVQVTVTDANGTSATSTILPPYEGTISFNSMGVLPPVPGAEEAPAPTEYDYVPTPTITSVSTPSPASVTPADAGNLASETASPFPSTVTITGTGFNFQTLSAINFGDPTLESSQVTPNVISVTGTQIQLAAPALPTTTVNPTSEAVSVDSLGGQSASGPAVTYAGVPVVTSVSPPVAPDTGGTTVTVQGDGFDQALPPLLVTDAFSPFSLGTVYDVAIPSNTSATFTTPAMNPALADVQLCSVSGCSPTTPADEMIVYPPGAASVTSASPARGPAHGGTTVVLNGDNLGCVVAIRFGSVMAEQFTNEQALLDCGSTTQLLVAAPPGVAGKTVHVSVMTIEGAVTGSGWSSTTATFTYTKSTPGQVSGLRTSRRGDAAVLSWEPPASNGGSPVTGYVVTAYPVSGGNQVTARVGAKARSATLAPLQAGVTYRLAVHALNASGVGLYSGAGTMTARTGDHGYLLASSEGGIVGLGSLTRLAGDGSVAAPRGAVAGVAVKPQGTGYWVATSKGAVYGRGTAHNLGSVHSAHPVVGIAPTPDGGGYYVVTRYGNVYGFGDALFAGSIPSLVHRHKLASDPNNVVGIVASPRGGYWIVTATGHVYPFGGAVFAGSIPTLVHRHLLAKDPGDIVAMAPAPNGQGYWLVGRNGSVFNFGKASFEGSVPSLVSRHVLSSNPMDVVGIAGAPRGEGYWLAGANGDVYRFGSAVSEGSGRTGGLDLSSVVGIGG